MYPGPGQMPGGPPQQGGPPPPGQENLNALQKAIDSMEEKGLQEDPRCALLTLLHHENILTIPPSPGTRNFWR